MSAIINDVGRPNRDDYSIAEIKLKYNDQPMPNDSCPCGKGKKYLRCCGKNKKEKFNYLKVTFRSPKIGAEHHIEIHGGGVRVCADNVPVEILSSEIILSYSRKKKCDKVIVKIALPGITPLLTPDNIFQYYEKIYAVDTNTDNVSGVSACTACSITPTESSRITCGKSGEIRVGKCSGAVNVETIFLFKEQKLLAEKFGWFIVIRNIARNFSSDKRYAIIVDSELTNLDSFNSRRVPFYLGYVLPGNIDIIYASADYKNASLINYAINYCDTNSKKAIIYNSGDFSSENVASSSGTKKVRVIHNNAFITT